jgi:hypothetical protein
MSTFRGLKYKAWWLKAKCRLELVTQAHSAGPIRFPFPPISPRDSANIFSVITLIRIYDPIDQKIYPWPPLEVVQIYVYSQHSVNSMPIRKGTQMLSHE